MPKCQMCKRDFKKLRFHTEDIRICTRCVNTLNESPAPASTYKKEFSEMLSRGMLRNAQKDLNSTETWKREKAKKTLENLEFSVEEALHDWITKLLAKPDNNGERKFMSMRAYRRGILRMDGFADRPNNWKDFARQIRQRDKYQCMDCGATDTLLDVHHIIYLSHHGTNQKHNLVTLCRKCHEAVHGREFDILEVQEHEEIIEKKEEKQYITQNISEPKNITTTESFISTDNPQNPDRVYPEPPKIQTTTGHEQIILDKTNKQPIPYHPFSSQKTSMTKSVIPKNHTKNANNLFSEELIAKEISEQDRIGHPVTEENFINHNTSASQSTKYNLLYTPLTNSNNDDVNSHLTEEQKPLKITKDSRKDAKIPKTPIPKVISTLIEKALIIVILILSFYFFYTFIVSF